MADKKYVLFIIGTMNQSTMMHEISRHLGPEYEACFTTFYGDGWLKRWTERGWIEMTIMGKSTQKANVEFCRKHGLNYDYRGESRKYDLAFMCQDVSVPENLKDTRKVLVQEGILEPMDWRFYTTRFMNWPRVLADSAMTGLSDSYDVFCVFSEGYRKEFIKRGVKAEKMIVTSSPNFDNVGQYLDNDFPFRDFVLVATSNHRETKRYENRKALIRKAVKVAKGRQVIFKLHPREDIDRAIREIRKYGPKDALIYTEGNTEEMIANCAAMLTSYSTTMLTAACLGKEIHCEYSMKQLNELKPIQTGGTSGKRIAEIGMQLLT